MAGDIALLGMNPYRNGLFALEGQTFWAFTAVELLLRSSLVHR
jgi:hypothetical protein